MYTIHGSGFNNKNRQIGLLTEFIDQYVPGRTSTDNNVVKRIQV